MNVVKCSQQNLQAAAGLFDDYRVFYRRDSDPDTCHAFLKNNLGNRLSEIYLLLDDNDTAVAFAQLYPSVCSISLQPFFILSDLYVSKTARGKGHGKYLMQYLLAHFKARNVQRLTLETATSNTVAQSLYESTGYKRDDVFITYHHVY